MVTSFIPQNFKIIDCILEKWQRKQSLLKSHYSPINGFFVHLYTSSYICTFFKIETGLLKWYNTTKIYFLRKGWFLRGLHILSRKKYNIENSEKKKQHFANLSEWSSKNGSSDDSKIVQQIVHTNAQMTAHDQTST